MEPRRGRCRWWAPGYCSAKGKKRRIQPGKFTLTVASQGTLLFAIRTKSVDDHHRDHSMLCCRVCRSVVLKKCDLSSLGLRGNISALCCRVRDAIMRLHALLKTGRRFACQGSVGLGEKGDHYDSRLLLECRPTTY